MTELLPAGRMRAVERAAIAAGWATGLELMERAARGTLGAVFEEWPALAASPRRALVFCGPGNNGGDGFAIARLLAGRGWKVAVHLHADPARLPPDASANRERCPAKIASNSDWPERDASDADLIVDAMFGAGALRQPEGAMRRALLRLARVRREGRRVVAVDLPSGICADSGRPVFRLDDGGAFAVEADLTVAFHAPKPGHYLDRGPEFCGRLRVASIGLPARGAGPHDGYGDSDEAISLVERAPVAPGGASGDPESAALGKRGSGHKYGHGHALVLSGGSGRGGAARLAARGALRAGAGLVTLGCPPDALAENSARLDAVMLRVVGSGEELQALLEEDGGRIGALCLGPGLGLGAREAGLVAAALISELPVLLDADALTLLAKEPDLFGGLHAGCLLTPHAGEFARLFPDIHARLSEPAAAAPAYSKLDGAREAAARAGCAVLFKGADTVIADRRGRVSVNAAAYDRAAPWLATAGSGDVLAGLAAGLLARGMDPMRAASSAAWLHVEAARIFGPGLIAEDLPEAIPGALRNLGH